jgi:hypothetical protein
LVKKWQREILETLPNVTTQAITNWKEAIAFLDKKGVPPSCGEWYVIARDRAKLGAKWRTAVVNARRKVKTESGLKVVREVHTCPTCGKPVSDEDGMLLALEVLERKPMYCRRCNGALWTYTADLRRWAPATLESKKAIDPLRSIAFVLSKQKDRKRFVCASGRWWEKPRQRGFPRLGSPARSRRGSDKPPGRPLRYVRDRMQRPKATGSRDPLPALGRHKWQL